MQGGVTFDALALNVRVLPVKFRADSLPARTGKDLAVHRDDGGRNASRRVKRVGELLELLHIDKFFE
jgi:hypothetical protein